MGKEKGLSLTEHDVAVAEGEVVGKENRMVAEQEER